MQLLSIGSSAFPLENIGLFHANQNLLFHSELAWAPLQDLQFVKARSYWPRNLTKQTWAKVRACSARIVIFAEESFGRRLNTQFWKMTNELRY